VGKLRAFLLLILAGTLAQAAAPEKSVVQIVTFSQQPVWDSPWRLDSVRKSSGTGFVVKGKRIMTNAHVVSWARQILVRRYQDPRPYVARVDYIGHDCDLALLEVQEDRFFDGLEALELGELPKVRSTVVTYGYPAGGEQISYTRGVVSRIEIQNYVHIGNRNLLAVQTDAAINPGNSGGPVIQDDKVVGVSFQGMPGLENAGFFIPPPIVQHFLKDIADGRYDGFPQAGVGLAPLQNEAYRRFLKVPDDDRGVRIDRIYPVAPTQAALREDDVLLKLGSYDVGSDGTILYDGNRMHLSAAISDAQHGDTLALQLVRGGKLMDVSLPVGVIAEDRAEGNLYEPPRYMVYGGLVFTPLSRDYLRAAGQAGSETANAELIYELFYRRIESPKTARKEPVVLAAVLAHAVNANLEVRGRALVDRINGVRIEKLDDVARALDAGTQDFDVIEFMPDHHFECLERGAVAQAHAEILKTYGVPKDRRL
jgi:S1-C subfamily serine protease